MIGGRKVELSLQEVGNRKVELSLPEVGDALLCLTRKLRTQSFGESKVHTAHDQFGHFRPHSQSHTFHNHTPCHTPFTITLPVTHLSQSH
jgi:hypothetical protein